MNAENRRFLTPRKTAEQFDLPLHYLRQQIAQGAVPGFRSGNRFYVDIPAFKRALEALCAVKEGGANIELD